MRRSRSSSSPFRRRCKLKRAFTVGKTFKTVSTLEDFTLLHYEWANDQIFATLEMFADGSKRQIDASRLLDY
ncbi:hypothetical protein OVA29_14130 [Exiguobacterium sp. SL14]|nr:hypothetical protein [Exiguobacterium sp. SL14]MCY1691678.1 hypothetical protein [Exiguobacterium sp. SL14]